MNRIERHQRQPAPGLPCVVIGPRAALIGALASLTLTSGCAVVTVAGAAASVAATAASTVVDVGVGAVKVTGRVIGKGVDLVAGPPTPPTPSRH